MSDKHYEDRFHTLERHGDGLFLAITIILDACEAQLLCIYDTMSCSNIVSRRLDIGRLQAWVSLD